MKTERLSDLFIPMRGDVEMGIGTRAELEALIADGILPPETTLRPLNKSDLLYTMCENARRHGFA